MTTPFILLKLSIGGIRHGIPNKLFERDTIRGMGYLTRDITMAMVLWHWAYYLDGHIRLNAGISSVFDTLGLALVASRLSLHRNMGYRSRAYKCGHGAFFDKQWIVHTALWTPYCSWKISHHRHHSNHASMERDEVYVPWTRAELNIPDDEDGTVNYEEYLGDTPLYTLAMLIGQQMFAFPAYLYPSDKAQSLNWFVAARSTLFSDNQRNAVILSNLGTLAMIVLTYFACAIWGLAAVVKYYGIPWLCVNHWFVMITYLHHTDSSLPHYRAGAWKFARGAAATVDRDFLGRMGDFFLHGVAHFHVIHHFFPKMPFYHGPEATQYLKVIIGDQYQFSSKSVFKALWDNYNDCQFVENTGKHILYDLALWLHIFRY
ncbi:uncharacterized protein PHACADRAFT_186478 [Phanerochaete carnosa HHB-10118-sp]|uniref:Fatty acid desaturase domain-containing protein n=1 Tax=Phanerochaete carnosa (strain HHB-10118-sp) TaxID=650164 RepID=K5WPR2_PHACS|nr:uncharacterized protein PHACADRAFT_186478 [Phanerochaete carnosa HHB-10118-sp]EKM52302.1 hypothetical protein PHACADRAFT_186478 [Phanerochaete carnosa HHB-10118-sp]